MTFDEALSIPKDLRFQKNGSEKYYRLIIESLGYEEVKRCIPFTLGELKKAYKKDQSFNTLSIMNWDYAAGYITRGSDVFYIGSSLTRLYNVKGGNGKAGTLYYGGSGGILESFNTKELGKQLAFIIGASGGGAAGGYGAGGGQGGYGVKDTSKITDEFGIVADDAICDNGLDGTPTGGMVLISMSITK